ncbi:MAG: hypothetical protein IT260_21960 [Saprospiraceae bacterium]|nr:hypothetical protein [Saprospiraceae bacterium]
MNERVLKAFLERFGIKNNLKKTQLPGFKPLINHTNIEIPHYRIRIEAFYFSYNFLQLEHEEQISALCKLVEDYGIDYIFSDYELNRLSVPNDAKEPSFYYSIKPGEFIPLHGNLLTGNAGIYARLGHRIRGKIHGIVLYGYMDNKLSYDIKKMKGEIEADIQRFAPAFAPPEVIIIDTSTYFTKANEEEFYIDRPNLRIKASARIRQEYSDLVGYLTFEWFETLRQKKDKIKTNEGLILEKLFKPQDYFNTNNLEVAYYIKTVNALNTSEWQIGSASFFINNFDNKKERFLVDVPFRDYDPFIDLYIEDKKLTSFFYDGFDPKKGNLVQNRYFYFEYTYDYKAIQINLLKPPVSNFEENANKNQVDFNKLILEYIPLAHSVVFYEPEAGKNLKGCKVVSQPHKHHPAPKHIQMLCLFNGS